MAMPHTLPLPRSLQALLLDRDGTLNVERADYVREPEALQILPGVLEALARAAQWQVPVLVLTNQSCVGRGLVAPQMLDAIHAHLRAQVEAAGGRIDGFFVCPHHPDAGCACRKPRPGLLLQAATAFGLDLGQCIFIGDSSTDLQAAHAAGCPAIYVGTGRQGPTPGHPVLTGAVTVATSLAAALDLLVAAGALPAEAPLPAKECA
jgi:D-glycero-D-manno-heptose 1,7-bisphosphate phosphatase